MWLRVGILVLSTIGCYANAQEIVVRSGAHDSFTRLVIRIPEGRDWSVEEDETGVRISVEQHIDGFEISDVFRLIDKRHIKNIRSEPESIYIEYSCNCSVSTFVERETFLVIDVSLKSENRIFGQADAILDRREPASQPRLSFPSENQPQRQSISELETSLALNTASADDQTMLKVPSISNSNIELEQNPKLTSDNQLAEVQQKLAQRIARAATQGILEPTQRVVEIPLTNSRTTTEPSGEALSEFEENNSSVVSQTNNLNLRITSSSDNLPPSSPGETVSTSMGVKCISPESVAVESWGKDEEAAQQISEYRGALYTEADRLDEQTAVNLARLYLHYGFGAEAKQVLTIDANLALRNEALIEIADIMEYGDGRGGQYLKRFADCPTPVALWGILAWETLDPSVSIDANAALRALTALPTHLRRFIAPNLSRRLLQYGDEARAETALRSIDRTPEQATANTKLARAELQLAKGETQAAQQTLSGVISSNEQQSAEALIKFVDTHLEADTQIDESVATLVEAYAVEMRGNPLGVELKRAHVLALAKSGQFDPAFDALSRLRTRDSGERERTLRTLLLDIVTRSASDVVFLERAFEYAQAGQDPHDPRVSFDMATRAINLGFAQLAELILLNSQTLPQSSRIKELRARIALELGRPLEAESLLFGVDSEAATRLRAQAKTLEQNHSDAISIYDELGDQGQMIRSALLAEDWERLSQAETGSLSAVVDLIDESMETSNRAEGMLGRMSNAIEESQQARKVIQTLLEDPAAVSSAEDP